jgi:Plasmid pRiA4b ORF-3-like protein
MFVASGLPSRLSIRNQPTTEPARRRASITYTLRIEHATYSTSQINVASANGKSSYLASTNPSITEMSIQPNWSREFTVLGQHTLEQLNEIILHILGWEQGHLFEFRFADRV